MNMLRFGCTTGISDGSCVVVLIVDHRQTLSANWGRAVDRKAGAGGDLKHMCRQICRSWWSALATSLDKEEASNQHVNLSGGQRSSSVSSVF